MMEQTAYATATPVLYELSGVEKSCEGPAERITILKNMDLTVRAGESLAIVGASGSGKSTLLHLQLRFFCCHTLTPSCSPAGKTTHWHSQCPIGVCCHWEACSHSYHSP